MQRKVEHFNLNTNVYILEDSVLLEIGQGKILEEFVLILSGLIVNSLFHNKCKGKVITILFSIQTLSLIAQESCQQARFLQNYSFNTISICKIKNSYFETHTSKILHCC